MQRPGRAATDRSQRNWNRDLMFCNKELPKFKTPDRVSVELSLLMSKTDRYHREYMNADNGFVSRRKNLEEKLLVYQGRKAERHNLTIFSYGKSIELKSLKDNDQGLLSFNALKRYPRLPAGYVLSFLQMAAAQAAANHKPEVIKTLEQLADGDETLLALLKEALVEVQAVTSIKSDDALFGLPARAIAVEEMQRHLDAEDEAEVIKKRSLHETALSMRNLLNVATAIKAWESVGLAYRTRENATQATAAQRQQMRSGYWQNAAFQDHLAGQASSLGLVVDAQEKRIKHLEYIRYLNYKEELQQVEDDLRGRNLLAGVDLHADEKKK